MPKIIAKPVNLEKDKWDYCAGIASIYSTTTAKVVRAAIDLCYKNNEVFVEFLKNTLENERLKNDNIRAARSVSKADE
jgi:hypothetical protein